MSSMDRPFIILGGGGHALVVESMLRLLGKSILGFTDPSPEARAASRITYLGDDSALRSFSPDAIYCAMGIGSTSDTRLRRHVYEEISTEEFVFPPLVHPGAIVAPEATLKAGVQVMAGAVIQAGVTLSDNVLVNTSASVDHDCRLDAHGHVAPGATISGGVHLGLGVHVGTGASIIQNVRVGRRSVIGAGAVVVDDISSNVTAVGAPARSVR